MGSQCSLICVPLMVVFHSSFTNCVFISLVYLLIVLFDFFLFSFFKFLVYHKYESFVRCIVGKDGLLFCKLSFFLIIQYELS